MPLFPLYPLPIILDKENWWHLTDVVHRPHLKERPHWCMTRELGSPEMLDFELDPEMAGTLCFSLGTEAVLRRADLIPGLMSH